MPKKPPRRPFPALPLLALTGIALYLLTAAPDAATRSVLWPALGLAALWAFQKAPLLPLERRARIAAGVLSAFFALAAVLGSAIDRSASLKVLCASWGAGLQALLCLMGLWAFFDLLLTAALKRALGADYRLKPASRPAFTANAVSFFTLWALIFICWLPYFIIFYPGILEYDSVSEMNHILSMIEVIDHHPFIHQMVIRKLVLLGKALFGTYMAGVAIYTLVQMAFMAGVSSACLCFLARLKLNRPFRIAAFLYFAVFLSTALYNLMMLKDVWFAGFALLTMILLFNEALWGDAPLRPLTRWLTGGLLCGALLGFCLFRNNGYYAFLIAFPFFILLNRKRWKRLTAIGLMVVLLVTGYHGYIYNVLGVLKPRVGEALSLPLQQIVRSMKEQPESFTDDRDNAAFRELLPEAEALCQRYDPFIADPVKDSGLIGYDSFQRQPARYLSAWARQFFRSPGAYFEAFLCLNYGYWYPDALAATVALRAETNSHHIEMEACYQPLRDGVSWVFDALKALPPLSALMSIGFWVWLTLFSAVILLLKRQGRAASPMLLMLGLWLTNLASPVSQEFRYLYGLILSAPLCLGVALALPNQPKTARRHEHESKPSR